MGSAILDNGFLCKIRKAFTRSLGPSLGTWEPGRPTHAEQDQFFCPCSRSPLIRKGGQSRAGTKRPSRDIPGTHEAGKLNGGAVKVHWYILSTCVNAWGGLTHDTLLAYAVKRHDGPDIPARRPHVVDRGEGTWGTLLPLTGNMVQPKTKMSTQCFHRRAAAAAAAAAAEAEKAKLSRTVHAHTRPRAHTFASPSCGPPPSSQPGPVLLAHFEKTKIRHPAPCAMCHDPSFCRGDAGNKLVQLNRYETIAMALGSTPGQVGIHCPCFFFFPCLLSQLLHRVPIFPVHALSMPVPCPSSRPSPIPHRQLAGSLAMPGFANYSLFPGRMIARSVLSGNALSHRCFNSEHNIFREIKCFSLRIYGLFAGSDGTCLSPPLVLLFVVSHTYSVPLPHTFLAASLVLFPSYSHLSQKFETTVVAFSSCVLALHRLVPESSVP